MKVAVIGHKHVGPADPEVIAAKMIQTIVDPDVEEILIPGIDGMCACALSCAILARDEQKMSSPIITVVFPGKLGERPPWSPVLPSPEEWSKRADKVLELGAPMGFSIWSASMDACYKYVIEQVAECGQVLVFWNGSGLAGTARHVHHIQQKLVAWEHVEVTGEP